MKRSYLDSGLLIILIIAVAFAGCTTQTTSTKSGDFGQASPGGAGTGTSSGAPVGGSFPPKGSTVNSSEVFSENIKWVEYRHTDSNNGITTVSDYKIESGPSEFKGQPAYHTKTTITNADSSVIINDVYWDTSKKDILGGTMTFTANGVPTTSEIAPFKQKNGIGGTEFENSIPLVFEGVEPVTVPFGTYDKAGKYVKKFTLPNTGEITETNWVVHGVAPPLKYTQVIASEKGSYSMNELVAWG